MKFVEILNKNKEFIKNLAKKIGINKAIFYFLIGKILSFVFTPITLYLIATHFTPVEQGYYYTFLSFLAISIFFELGLGVVITQFASHEYSNLSWTEENRLTGDLVSLSKIISLLRKSLKWYFLISVLFMLIMIPTGIVFFSSKPESTNVSYIIPWVLLVIFFSLCNCSIPLTSTIEGCGHVSQVQQLRVIQSVMITICAWITIIIGGKLIVVSVMFITSWLVIVTWLLSNYKNLLLQILKYKIVEQISWFNEVFPMQWRVAISWVSAYFTNYLFVPLLFNYRGSIEAGKMGMSLKLAEMVFVVSIAWVNTRIPYYGALIKKKKYEELDRIALNNTVRALLVGFCISLMIITGLRILNIYIPKYKDKILPDYIVGVLCFANIVNVVNSSIAGYLRAYKEEPLMVESVIIAIFVGIVCFLTAKYYNANIMAVSYMGIVSFIGFPLFYWKLLLKRKEWQIR